MGVIEDAVDDILSDPDLRISVTYTPALTGTPAALTNVGRTSCPRDYLDADGVRVIAGMRTFYILVDDLLVEPVRRDTIVFNTETYSVVQHTRAVGEEHYEVDAQLEDS